jgi:xanthine permease XanP
MFGIAAPIAPGAPTWGGALVAAIVVAVMLIAQAAGRPWARLGSVLFGLIAGYLVCGFAGWLQAPAPSDGTWIVIPKLLPHDLDFSWALLVPFAFIYLVSVLEALGDMTATSQLSGLDTTGPEHWTRLRGGIIADGLTSIFAALTGGFPSTTFAQNNGVIQITGVASRRIGPIMALMLAALGLFPAVGRWVTAMPGAILGALALMLFGLVAVSGLRLIERAGLTSRNALIIALSLAVGLGAPTQAAWIKTLPGVIQALLDSGIAAGGLTALALNQILRERP